MMYYTILASFCLLGMARSQTITSLTPCLTKDQNLQMECKFTIAKLVNATCTYEVDNKVVATTASSKTQDAAYKNRAIVKLDNSNCVLNLTGFSDDGPKMFKCTIHQEKSDSKSFEVDKKKISPCSAGNTLKNNGVILPLAYIIFFLFGML